MIRLKELREERGWSMRKAAEFLGQKYTTYVNHEKMYREPNSEDLKSYARHYDVSIDYLVGRTDKKEPALAKEEPKPQEEIISRPDSPLEQNFYNLIQLIVRYGERPIDLDGTVYSIGEVIIWTIENDDIKPPKPVYQTIIDEFKRHYKDDGFKAESFYKFHSDPQVCALAIDMITEKYQHVKSDTEERLGEVVTRMLYELKLTTVNMQIDELEAGLKEAQETNDWNRQMALLARQPELLEQRNELCKVLGNRVINI